MCVCVCVCVCVCCWGEILLKKYLSLFILRKRGAEREERENPKQAPHCQSELDAGLELMNWETMTELLSRVGHLTD